MYLYMNMLHFSWPIFIFIFHVHNYDSKMLHFLVTIIVLPFAFLLISIYIWYCHRVKSRRNQQSLGDIWYATKKTHDILFTLYDIWFNEPSGQGKIKHIFGFLPDSFFFFFLTFVCIFCIPQISLGLGQLHFPLQSF